MSAPFARLDFRNRPPRLYTPFTRILTAHTLAEVAPAIAELSAALASGQVAVGFIGYEAAPAFDPALTTHPPAGPLPLLWFGLAAAYQPAPDLPPTPPPTLTDWQPALTRADYTMRFDTLLAHIAAGDTYQVNFTFPLRGVYTGERAALYAHLRRAQPHAYSAWIHTAEWDVFSASPELFFALDGAQLTTRPMKGTARRGRTSAEDAETAAALRASQKERAENVMIVDLLRNDLSRVAETGSVGVPDLFTLERYSTLWQMTSTVTATRRADTDLWSLLAALFPCGSITGAPKVRTMQLIAEQEVAPRGVYCGAIGALDAPDQMLFNVAIRTLTVAADGPASYAVGSGLVADSQAEAEYVECLLKSRVLFAPPRPTFDLLESLCFDPAHGYTLLERHLARLADSAAYFDYPCDPIAIRAELLSASANWPALQKVCLTLSASGAVAIAAADLTPPGWRLPRTVALAAAPIDPTDVFLYHKTTHRAVYDAAQAACPPNAETVVLFNPHGELTESITANLAVEIDGVWVTPPVSSGLLAGTLRAELLATGQLTERVVTLADLPRITGWRLFNSVRGLWDVTWVTQ